VLVASTREPALEGVKASLDLTWRVQRVLQVGVDLEIVSPLVPEADAWAVARAFALARERRAHVASVGASPRWLELVAAEEDRHPGVVVERLALEEALPALAHGPDRLDVVVTEEVFAEALSTMAASSSHGPRVVASGRLAERGTGVFGPTHGSAPEIAGQGVANPTGILLAAALMLGEGLGERAAARTLTGAVAEILAAGALTADMLESGEGATTRQFMDALLAELPGARKDHEFAVEVR
jgi:3-isopropylmalate dehydrogenase